MRAPSVFALLTALLIVGCAASGRRRGEEARLSAGSVPCQANEITISNSNYGSKQWRGGVWTWTATCNEKRYFCSSRLPPSASARGETWSIAECSER